MSENTNTLFWVITGAVIVLAVFLLINNSQDSTLTNISNKFNSLWSQLNKAEIKNADESEEEKTNNIIDINNPVVYVDGFEVGLIKYNDYEQFDDYIMEWYFKNLMGERISGYEVYLYLYNKDTDELNSIRYYHTNPYLDPDETLNITSFFLEKAPENFYIEVEVRKPQ